MKKQDSSKEDRKGSRRPAVKYRKTSKAEEETRVTVRGREQQKKRRHAAIEETTRTIPETEEKEFVNAQVLMFEMNGQQYALDLKFVEEVIPMMKITTVPRAPEFIEGVVQIRGRVIPVMDLRRYFGGKRTHYFRLTRIVLVDIHNRILGIIADGVSRVVELTQEMVKKAVIMHDRAKFVDGMAKVDKNLVQLLEIDKLLDEQELAVLTETV